MKRYFFEDVKCGVSAGGFACGPVDGSVNASLKINDGESVKWLTLSELMGIPDAFLTEDDVYEKLINNDFSDEFTDYMNAHHIDSYNGIAFEEGYYETFSNIEENPENPANPVVRYLVSLIRCSMEETEMMIELGKGKYADEIDVPMSDVEEEYMEDKEEYDD